MEPVIETKGLAKAYGKHTAVAGLDLVVEKGEIFGFLGPNGAGKTTTLLMLLGLTVPTGGTARVLGYDPVREPLKVKGRVGYLAENMGFYQDMTARENLLYVTRLNRMPDKQGRERAAQALEQVGLADQANKLVGKFSRGMRQRLGIAEVLVKDPGLIFLDEPTLGLDPDGINRMLDLIVSLADERAMTVFLSSHLLNQVQRICHRVGIMNQGHLVASGSVAELIEQAGGSLEAVYMSHFQEA